MRSSAFLPQFGALYTVKNFCAGEYPGWGGDYIAGLNVKELLNKEKSYNSPEFDGLRDEFRRRDPDYAQSGFARLDLGSETFISTGKEAGILQGLEDALALFKGKDSGLWLEDQPNRQEISAIDQVKSAVLKQYAERGLIKTIQTETKGVLNLTKAQIID